MMLIKPDVLIYSKQNCRLIFRLFATLAAGYKGLRRKIAAANVVE